MFFTDKNFLPARGGTTKKVSPSNTSDRMMKFFNLSFPEERKSFSFPYPHHRLCLVDDWNCLICRVFWTLLTTNKLGASMLIDWDDKKLWWKLYLGAFYSVRLKKFFVEAGKAIKMITKVVTSRVVCSRSAFSIILA